MLESTPVVDLNVARSTAAGELVAQLAMGIQSGTYQTTLRRKCAIIDAMTPHERTHFSNGIDISRIDEIAARAGVHRTDVVALLNGYTILADVVSEELPCHCTHDTMIAGTCPWCSEEVFSLSLPAIEEVDMGPSPCLN